MSKKLFFLITIFLLISILTTSIITSKANNGNNYPIVLVIGFSGWDRDEMAGFKYWGGFTDIQTELTLRGYTTFMAGIGPFSSNWDRACELYAIIKGGTVDYGAAHSARYGHARFGRTYPGIYPNISNTNKVHLLAHSMGGQTSRLFTHILEQGSKEEIEYAKNNPDIQLSDFFKGGKSWVCSVSTISTPHNGTSLTELGIIPLAKDLLMKIAATALPNGNPLYDFKMEHWNIPRYLNEDINSYFTKFAADYTRISATKDISEWDLSPDGAAELNRWVKAQPDVYYFSFANSTTSPSMFNVNDLDPTPNTLPVLLPTSEFMSQYIKLDQGHVVIDNKWFENDGVVNTQSMIGPSINSEDKIKNYSGYPTKGVWNYMGKRNACDHMDVVGINLESLVGADNILPWYLEVAKFLHSLQ